MKEIERGWEYIDIMNMAREARRGEIREPMSVPYVKKYLLIRTVH